MAIYSIARRTTGTTSGNAAFDVAAGANVRPRLLECGVFLGAATASQFGLNRVSNIGTRTSPVALMGEDPNDPTSECDSALAWSAEPTEATDDLRRIGLPATIGTGVIWTFPKGLVIAQSLSMIILNRSTTGVADVYVVVDE